MRRVAKSHGKPRTPEEIEATVDSMLKNLGARVMEALGYVGTKADKFDRAYAQKVYEMQGGPKGNPFLTSTSGEAIGDLVSQDATGSPLMRSIKYGAIGSNLASRYALPAGGAVALQQALADLYSGASDTEILG